MGGYSPSTFFTNTISGSGGLTLNTFNAPSTGAPNGGYTQPAIVVLSGNNNSFTGGLVLNPTGANESLTVMATGSDNALGLGPVTLQSGNATALANIQDDGSSTLTIGNQLILATANPNEITANGTFTLSGNIINLGGQTAGSLTKLGVGVLELNNAELYTGTTVLDGGTTTLGGTLAPLGTDLGTSSIAVNIGAALSIDNTAGGFNNVNRLNDAATINLSGGVFNYLGASTGASSELMGALILGAGAATISSTTNGTGTDSITFASLTRTTPTATSGGGTLEFTGGGASIGSASNKIVFTSLPTQNTGILPYAFVKDGGGHRLWD